MTTTTHDWPAVLERIGDLSPYFRVHADPGPDASPTATLGPDGGALVDAACSALRVEEPRVAASTVLFSYAARLWSVALATHLHTGRCVALGPQDLWWEPDGHAVRLSLPSPTAGGDVVHEVVNRQLGPLIRSWSRWVAPGALWGNAASALRGAARVLGPDVVPLLHEVQDHPLLRERYDPTGRRRSCCLYYRVSATYCGDCCLTPRRSTP